MFDLLLLASFLLFAVIVIASVLYYKRIRELREKYEDARDVVGDIVVSFNTQLQRYEDKLDAISHEATVLSSDHDKTRSEVKEHGEQLKKIVSRINVFSAIERKVPAKIQDANRRLESLVASQKEIAEKIEELERFKEKVSTAPRAEKAKVEAPIPIKREKALAPLTETELRVLEILAENGPKTAPKVREEIELTREHTARLMKKLYEEGYLERGVQKIPYTYHIKKEMLKILRKQA
ncbi:MAG: MarR family transcriptional regulator [Candidatus Bathyarchaeota archaeon]|nr:MarR family transcriptional regulator [Candidatus Bathyarchaeota archaeon]